MEAIFLFGLMILIVFCVSDGLIRIQEKNHVEDKQMEIEKSIEYFNKEIKRAIKIREDLEILKRRASKLSLKIAKPFLD